MARAGGCRRDRGRAVAPPREQRAVPFLLPRDRALEVFELLDPSLQQELLEGLRETNIRQLFEEMTRTTGRG